MDLPPDSRLNDYTSWNEHDSTPDICHPGNPYITPCHNEEPQYAELSETLVKVPAYQPEEQPELPDPIPHDRFYITPIHDGGREHCSNPTLYLLRKLLISGIFNILLLASLVTFLYTSCFLDKCSDDPPTVHVAPTTAPITEEDLVGTEICFLTKHIRCKGGLLRQSQGTARSPRSRNSPSGNMFQNEVQTLCCFNQSQSIQNLAHLFVLVKSHNTIRQVNRRNGNPIRTSEMSIACKMAVSSEQRLKLSADTSCSGDGIHVKRTSMHFLYLYLAINCSMHGADVIKAGIRSGDQVVAQQEMNCEYKPDIMTLTVFAFKRVTRGTVLVPFVSHTQCVYDDKDSNRLEILTVGT